MKKKEKLKKQIQFESYLPLAARDRIPNQTITYENFNLNGSLGPVGKFVIGKTKVNYNPDWITDIFDMDSANKAGTMIHRSDIYNILMGNEWGALSWYV